MTTLIDFPSHQIDEGGKGKKRRYFQGEKPKGKKKKEWITYFCLHLLKEKPNKSVYPVL